VTLITGYAATFVFAVPVTRFIVTSVPGMSWQQGDISRKQWQPAHSTAPAVQLPEAGELVVADYRSGEPAALPVVAGQLSVLTFNIYLGQNLAGLIDEISQRGADVILLQEDNIYWDQDVAVFRHAGGAIAKALQMHCCFTAAYFRRDTEGKLCGCYGMAILSRFELLNMQAFKCQVRPKIVEQMGDILEGHRHIPWAEIQLLQDTADDQGTRAGFASVHLPSVGLFKERLDMFKTLRRQIEAATCERDVAVVIGGDLNTLPFAARYVCFGTRDLLFSGISESSKFREVLAIDQQWKERQPVYKVERCFRDPFPDDQLTSMRGPQCLGAKLDWILVEQIRDSSFFDVISMSSQVNNNSLPIEQLPSDHKWLNVVLKIEDVTIVDSDVEVESDSSE